MKEFAVELSIVWFCILVGFGLALGVLGVYGLIKLLELLL